MKKTYKYLLYIGIALLFITAIFVYKRVFRDTSSIEGGRGSKKEMTQGGARGRGGRVLPVSIHIAEMMPKSEGVVRIGNLVANERVEIVSESAGRLVKINFEEGQFVKEGDLLVQLNDDELQVQLVRAEYQHKLLEERLERQKVLLEKDAVSREDYDMVLTEYNVLKQDMEQLKVKIERMVVRAPFDGVVGFRNVSLGAYLQPNSRITTLVDIANLKVEVAIPEKYAADRLEGSSINFTVEGLIDNFSANIYAVEPEVDLHTRTLMVKAKYNNRGFKLRPGMSARVTVTTGEGEFAVYVPNQAVVPEITGRSVWLLKEGKARSIPVQTGVRTPDMLEILSGVAPGDTVITTGLMQLREGLVVQPTND